VRRKLLRYLADKYDFDLVKRERAAPAPPAVAVVAPDPSAASTRRLLDVLAHPMDARQASDYASIPAIERKLFFRSSICTAVDFRDPEFARWRRAVGEPPRMHRKTWEHVFVAAHLEAADMLRPGRRGVGFGVGTEPSPASFAARGVEIVATDMAVDAAAAAGWVATDQHARGLEALNARGLCPPEDFAKRVSFAVCDMNAIPPSLNGFDFCWSACSLEHLGSIRAGIDFVRNSMKTLRPGGVAIHTTEYNISSNEDTIDNNSSLVVFRRRDIEQMVEELRRDNCSVSDVCYEALSEPIDLYVDVPPFKHDPHLRLELGGYVCSSIGIVAQRL
jgi:SAM-dependent methyltransferase